MAHTLKVYLLFRERICEEIILMNSQISQVTVIYGLLFIYVPNGT